ncbi:MAG TPA: amino acid ABC transporter permease [Alphaproteobacteria bacterium]|nr:amino acid ABC transporter permease [Alphaproteobacteria bacterium]
MDFTVIPRNLPYLLGGLGVTLETALLVILGGTAFGLGLGILRTGGPGAVRLLAAGYIEIIRGTPLLVVLFFVYFGLPPVIGYRLSAYEAAVIGFILFIGAYIAEDYRSGVGAVPQQQREGALALGLTPRQAMRHVVLPQAVRQMIPTLFNQFVRLVKFTSVAAVIGVTELTGAALAVNAREFQPVPIIATLAASYFVLCALLSLVGRWLNRRYAIQT